MRITKLEK